MNGKDKEERYVGETNVVDVAVSFLLQLQTMNVLKAEARDWQEAAVKLWVTKAHFDPTFENGKGRLL
jgi:hypothetical protein